MRALLGEHSFHDRVSKFFRTKATLALSKKPQRVARGETVEKVRFGGKKFFNDAVMSISAARRWTDEGRGE